MKNLIIIFIIFSLPALSQATQTAYKWHKVQNEKATALLIHGLNMRPEKMDAMIDVFNSAEISVLNLTLEGHGLEYEAFQNVNKEKWITNFKDAYSELKKYSEPLKLPRYLFGYSTGATVALAAEIRQNQPQFNKRILMSPAIKMTWVSNIVRILFPFSSLSLPSSNLNDFRRHGSTPMPAYKSLFELADEVSDGPKNRLNNTPTLVIIDPKDEMVSLSSLRAMKAQKQLSHWDVFTVFTDVDYSKARAPHHSIIHEFFTGPKLWSEMSKEIKSFLNSNT